MGVEEVRPQLIVIEDEIRSFIRRPGCPACAQKGHKVYLEENNGQVLIGPQEMAMVVWSCPECEFSVNLPPGAFPQHGFQVVQLEGPPPQKPGPEEN